MVTSLQAPSRVTLEAFLVLPETKPAGEYIDGQIYQKPMPQGKHSTLQSEIVTLINQRAKARKLAYAFPELRCTFGGRSIVPDISVFCWEHIPLDERGEIANKVAIAPDWLIEILSPDQSSIQLVDKISFALRQGTQLGWLIAPEERVILVFEGDRLPITTQAADLLPVLSALKDWQLTASDVFKLLNFSLFD